MIRKFNLLWENYIFESFLAAVTIFLVLLFLSIGQAVIIAAICATAFIVFVMPKNVTANPRNIIGGHLVSLFTGSLCALIPQPSLWCSIMAYQLAVGLPILIMMTTNTGHPPAAATTLGLAIMGFSLSAAIAAVTGAVLLSLAHHFLKPFLGNQV